MPASIKHHQMLKSSNYRAIVIRTIPGSPALPGLAEERMKRVKQMCFCNTDLCNSESL